MRRNVEMMEKGLPIAVNRQHRERSYEVDDVERGSSECPHAAPHAKGRHEAKRGVQEEAWKCGAAQPNGSTQGMPGHRVLLGGFHEVENAYLRCECSRDQTRERFTFQSAAPTSQAIVR